MCQLGPVKLPWGTRRGHGLKSPFPVVFDRKKCFLTNRMHFHDLKVLMKKCSCFRCHFEVSILTRFGISGHYIHILGITGEGSVPEMRIWSILLIESDLKRCLHLSRSFFLFIYSMLWFNKFDWLMLILRLNWICRIWFWILFLRSFCILLSDFACLLPFSNNSP